MGRMNIAMMRYMEQQHFRLLTAVEMGMKNHELVPLELIGPIAGIHRGGCARILADLCKHGAVAHERGKRYDGYRLTTFGYDLLALRALNSRKVVEAVGNQIGVGKESDVFIGSDPEQNDIVLKFHRLGRTSFRKLKEKRDYHKKRKTCSWLYLSRLAASKEFTFLKALYDHKFPVPRPIDVCRHLVAMDLICGRTLCNVQQVKDIEELYDALMTLIVRLARYGLIHGDFNEFNIMLTNEDEPILIDLPQMVSTSHPNAQFFFERDVDCVRTFFRKRFHYVSELYPKFENILRKYNLDVEVSASGFNPRMSNSYSEGVISVDGVKSSDSEIERYELDEDVHVHNNVDNIRMKEWIKCAQDNLARLDINSSSISDDNSCCIDEKLEGPAANGSHKYTALDLKENEFGTSSQFDVEEGQAAVSLYGKTNSQSKFSTVSTMAPELIRKRIATEAKACQKRFFRVKGKANASVRQRSKNADIIKELSGWV